MTYHGPTSPPSRRALLLCALLLSAPLTGWTQTSTVEETSPQETATGHAPLMTLDDALALTLEAHPSLRVATAQQSIADARVRQALASRRPTVTASAAYELSVASGVSRVGGAIDIPGVEQSDRTNLTTQRFYSLGVTASQRIYDFGATRARIRASEASALAAASSALSTEQGVLLQVRIAWHEALAAQEMLRVAAEALSRATESRHQVSRLVEEGLRAPVELAQADADLASAELRQVNAEQGVHEAWLGLLEAMGVTEPIAFRPASAVHLSLEEESWTDDALLEQAIAQRPDMQALRASLQAQELSTEAAERAGLPVLSATGNFSATGRDDQRIGWSAAVGVRLSWDAYRGGSVRAQAEEARAQLTVQQAEAERTLQQLRTELLTARSRIRSAGTGLSSAERATEAARERLRLAEGRYSHGVGTLMEVSDARLALIEAEGQRVQAELDLAVARSRMLAALGRAW